MLLALQTVCADHRWGWGPGPWIGLLWLAVAAVVVALFVRRGRRWRAVGGRMGGEAVLAERYARGEIDAAEYRDRLAVLREGRR
jgi:putative membrane protein